MMCKTQNILCQVLKAGGKAGISLFFVVQMTFALAAQTVTVAWNPNTETDLAGYNLYVGTQSGVYSNRVSVGNITSNTVSGLARGVRYYFAVTAYNTAGAESDYSTEISYLLPATNHPPTLSALANQTLPMNTQSAAIPFTVQDLETPAGNLTLQAASTNPGLIAPAQIIFGGSGANRTLTLTPALNQSGTVTITVTLSDGSTSVARQFLLSVTASSLDSWRTQTFSQADLSDPAKEATVWGDKADPDKDGRDNLLEFALGLAPLKKDPAKASLENSVVQVGDARYATLTFTRRKNEPALQYIPEVSGDGQAWSTGSTAVREASVTSVDNIFEKVVVQDLAPILPSAPRYFRLRVVKN